MKNRKNSIPRIISVLLVLVMLFTLGACSSQPAKTTGGTEGTKSAASKSAIVPGSVFNYALGYDLPSQMPWMYNTSMILAIQVFDNLLYRYHGDSNDIRGALAESWTVSPDQLVWTFQIRKGIKFCPSGTPLNADSFVKTWDVAKTKQPRFFAPVASYEATGEYELKVTLKGPNPSFMYDLPMQSIVGVVDPVALAKYGPEDNRSAIGCGPYYIANYVAGSQIVLKANPNYYNPDPDIAPQIETVNFNIITDENTSTLAMINGQIDAQLSTSVQSYKTLKNAGIPVGLFQERSYPYWMNAKKVAIFQNAKVREALAHMIDWDSVNKIAYDGMFKVLTSYMMGNGSYPYDDKYKYDPQLGVKMIQEAGLTKDDIAFSFIGTPVNMDEVTAIQDQFRKLGFNNIKIVQLDPTASYNALKAGTYDVTATHNGYSKESPLTPYTMGLLPNGTQRIVWLEYMDKAANEQALDLYNKANTALSFKAYLDDVSQITKIAQDQVCAFGGLQHMLFPALAAKWTNEYFQPVTGSLLISYIRAKK